MDLFKNRDWKPMLLKEIDKPFDSKDYLFEVKFDGIRAIIFVGPNTFQIRSRNKVDITTLYPELKSIQRLFKKNTILDGEIVCMDDGKPSFEKLEKRSHLKSENKIKEESFNNPVVFVAFDCIYQDKDLTFMPLIKRKKILDKIDENEYMIKSMGISTYGTKLFKGIKKLNLEGIVAKEKMSTYEIDTRSIKWIKIKNLNTEKFLIGGYQEKKNGIKSLLLGEYKESKFYYVGHVTLSGKSNLFSELEHAKLRKTSPFIDYNDQNVLYITPKITCLVKYLERTKNNHLRHPIIVK